MAATIINIANGAVRLEHNRSDVARADIVGVDVIFTLRSGGQILVPQLALRAVTGRPPTVQFTDGAFPASDVFSTTGKVDVTAQARVPLPSPPDGVPVEDLARRFRRLAAEVDASEPSNRVEPAAAIVRPCSLGLSHRKKPRWSSRGVRWKLHRSWLRPPSEHPVSRTRRQPTNRRL